MSNHDGELFERLVAWRLAVSKFGGIAAYSVASDRTLREVAQLRPRNRAQLKMVYGIGPSKAEVYGGAILDIVHRHVRLEEIERQIAVLQAERESLLKKE